MPTVNLNPGDISWHGTLTQNITTTINFADDLNCVEVVARDGLSTLWYTIDGTDPTSGGTRTYLIPLGVIGADPRNPQGAGGTVVKIVASDANTTISVQKVS